MNREVHGGGCSRDVHARTGEGHVTVILAFRVK